MSVVHFSFQILCLENWKQESDSQVEEDWLLDYVTTMRACWASNPEDRPNLQSYVGINLGITVINIHQSLYCVWLASGPCRYDAWNKAQAPSSSYHIPSACIAAGCGGEISSVLMSPLHSPLLLRSVSRQTTVHICDGKLIYSYPFHLGQVK